MPETISAGGLEFFVDNRRVGEDGGPSIRVRGMVEGQETELLRFDMFYKGPHYHYGPNGKDQRYDLDPLTHEDTIGWVITQLREKLPQMIAKAEYEAVIGAMDHAAVVDALPEIERRWRALEQVETATG